jgi:hypothetical protein
MEKTDTRKTAEKYVDSFVSQKRREYTVTNKFSILRAFTITLMNEYIRLARKVDKLEGTKHNLKQAKHIDVPIVKDVLESLQASIARHEAHAKKFNGRKVSSANKTLYEEIDAADVERIKTGQDSNRKQSWKIVVTNHKIPPNQADRLYKNYIEWKNNH